MFAELTEIDWPQCYNNYKSFSCYMPDQQILLCFIAVIMSEFNFKIQNEMVTKCLENKKKQIDKNIKKLQIGDFSQLKKNM